MLNSDFLTELKRRNVYRAAVIYVTAAVTVIQTADIAVAVFDLDDAVIQYVFAALFVLFIPVLLFSWAFEITPGGIKRDEEVTSDERARIKGTYRTERIVIALLVVAVLLLGVDRLLNPTGGAVLAPSTRAQSAETEEPVPTGLAGPRLNSIAVLPFRNMSPDRDNDYFCEGLSDTILNYLAQIPGLNVTARTSSFSFKAANEDIRQIAAQLGVETILDGGVQKTDERLRITAQLVRAEDGFNLWSRSYDRPLGDIFEIQDEISIDIVRALDESIDIDAKAPGMRTSNAEAFDLYLQALSLQSDPDMMSLNDARRLLEQALDEDPTFVDAQIGLSRNFMLQAIVDSTDTGLEIAASLEIANSVLAENPNEVAAHELVLVSRLLQMDLGVTPRGQSVDPIQAFDQLAESQLNPAAKALIAERFSAQGYGDEAGRLVSTLLERDPFNDSLLAAKSAISDLPDTSEPDR